MTRTIRAHFDGRVIVPDEPVDLPVGESLSVTLSSVETTATATTAAGAFLAAWARNRPAVVADDLPDDLAAQHDHYLYGTPKRP